MSLATIYNSPHGEYDRLVWSFSNSDHHLQVIDSIASTRNTLLARYLIDPIPPGRDLQSWLRTHQTMHNDVNSVLSVQGNDLTELDFNNAAELEGWVFLHASEHRQWANILGVD